MLIRLTPSEATETTETNRPKKERIEPKAIEVTDSAGVSYVCFTPSGGKEVGHIFIDYHALWSYAISLETEIFYLKREIDLLNENVERWRDLSFEMTERGDIYKKSFLSTHDSLIESEKERYRRNRFVWVPWGITAAVAIGFGVVLAAK